MPLPETAVVKVVWDVRVSAASVVSLVPGGAITVAAPVDEDCDTAIFTELENRKAVHQNNVNLLSECQAKLTAPPSV